MVRAAAIGTAVIMAVAVGAAAIAQEDSEADPGPPPPAGEPEAGEPSPADGEGSAELITSELITMSGATYDPTILTKFIAGSGFTIHQGLDPYGDVADYRGSANPTCLRADSASPAAAGDFLDVNASVELPDGARIKRIKFYGQNSDPAETILVRLHRVRLTVPVVAGPVVRTTSTVDSFSVPASSGTTAILGTDDLDEIAGSQFISAATGTEHNFHSVRVRMANSAGNDHRLCGLEVEYQVPVTADLGTVFHPLAGYRAYDSRLEMAPVDDGLLGAGPGRVIPVKDGRDVNTGVIDLPDAIPSTATAVAYTLTIASPTNPGFLFIAPGDAGSITASSINWDSNTTGALANSGIVQLDGEREVIVFAGGAGATTHFIIDITGYYAPAEFPNMAN